jgi:hypothetical protein
VGALQLANRDSAGRRVFETAAAVAIAGAALVAIRLVAPPSRLIVGPEAIPMTQILQTVAASAAVAVGLASLGWASTDPRIGRWLRIGAAVMTVYVVSVLAIDIVGLRVGPGTDLDELQTQGQVVLSVLWAILGVGALVYGIRADVREARQGGLLLLALATAKVFLFDLAALDVAYRVISLIALGLLLLMSAWFWQRAQPEQESGPP